MSRLLINEEPLQLLPGLAKAIGLNEAIVLQQIHYWLNKSDKKYEGKVWTYNSYSEWQKQFPWWSESTIKRIFQSLEKLDLLITGNFNHMSIDRTKWYTINYSRLDEFDQPRGQVDPTKVLDCTDERANLTPPIPETSTETSSEIFINTSFEEFWTAYPKKKSKEDARKAWKKLKLNSDLLTKILTAIEQSKKSTDWQEKNGKYIPYPATWLNGKRWEDDISGKPETPKRNIIM